MRKSSVLIVLITFALSVIIVGIFGMQFISYNTRIYVTSITPTEVTTSTNSKSIVKKSDKNENEWNIMIPYTKDVIVRIDYAINPVNATDNRVSLAVTSSNAKEVAEIDGLNIHVLKESTIRLNYRANDGNGAEITVYLYALAPEIFYSMLGA